MTILNEFKRDQIKSSKMASPANISSPVQMTDESSLDKQIDSPCPINPMLPANGGVEEEATKSTVTLLKVDSDQEFKMCSEMQQQEETTGQEEPQDEKSTSLKRSISSQQETDLKKIKTS